MIARLKKTMESIVGFLYPVAAFLLSISLMAYWMRLIKPVAKLYSTLMVQEDMWGRFFTQMAMIWQGNLKYLIYESILMLIIMVFSKKIKRMWDMVFSVICDLSGVTMENTATKKQIFHQIIKISQASDGSMKTQVYPLPHRLETENLSDDERGREFSDGFTIAVHKGEEVEVTKSGDFDAEPIMLGEKYKRVADGEASVFMKLSTEIHKIPKNTDKAFVLRTRDPFCKTYSGKWKRIPLKEQLWKAETNREILYFYLEDNFGDYRAVCLDPSIRVNQTRVDVKAPRTGKPNVLHLDCQRADGSVFSVELDYKERYYRTDIENGHESKIEAESDQRPCMVVGLFGSPGCGKTTLVSALSQKTVKDKIAALTGHYYAGEQKDTSLIRRTLIEEQNCLAFPIFNMKRNPVATIYFLDLSGEMVDFRKEDENRRVNIIESIGSLSDVIMEVFDDRSVFGDVRSGDINNIYTALANVRDMREYTFLAVCTKADKIRERAVKQPLMVMESGNRMPLFSPDSPVFTSVTDMMKQSYETADTLVYSHMAMAKDILSRTESRDLVKDTENDKCFIVSAGETCKELTGEIKIDTTKEINCELLLAYIMQLKFGISLRKQRED